MENPFLLGIKSNTQYTIQQRECHCCVLQLSVATLTTTPSFGLLCRSHRFVGQEFRKGSTGQFVSDPCGISWGGWDRKIHFQDGIFTHMSSGSVFHAYSSLPLVSHPPAPLHRALTSRGLVALGQSHFLCGGSVLQGRAFGESQRFLLSVLERDSRHIPWAKEVT